MAIDPNKYKKNVDIEPDTLLKTIKSIGSVLLMLLGIIGIAMEVFREDGFIQSGLAWLFESTTRMLLIPVIMLVLWLLNRWFSSANKGETRKSGNIPMVIMMLIGAFYLYRLITTGGL